MRTKAIILLAIGAVLLAAGPALAQGFGIGPRISLIRGHVPSGTPSARLFGGTIRMQTSRRMALEVAADYKKLLSPDGLTRERETPLQGSLLMFPIRGAFSPYVLAGYGLYKRTLDTLDSTGKVVSSISDKETGAHVGFGAEIFVSRRAAFFADYRFRFVRWGEPEEGSEELNIPFVDKAKLSHRGTMWTSGVAFYF
jgi:hypothetical protein